MTTSGITAGMVAQRKRLAVLLAQAAEVEHAVMCQYLFAASTMKATIDEGGVSLAQLEQMRVWRAHIMTVAREEMEHLGIVLNLLSAIGEAPVMRRANFPFSVSYLGGTLDLALEKFGPDTIRKFCLLEMPQGLPPDSRGWRILSQGDPHFGPREFDLIARVYDEIEALFTEIPEHALFIGPPAAQFVNDSIMPLSIRGISIAGTPVYNVNLRAVTDRPSALQAVSQIKEEGEGAKLEGGAGSHFNVFLDILAALLDSKDPAFIPARLVVPNPSCSGKDTTIITHPLTRQVMDLFDMCYETLVLLLIRFFASTDESSADEYAIERAAFFPMMTTVIRPLTECLTFLPVAEDSPDRAGASFTLPSNVGFLPHRDAAFELLYQNYTQMTESARALAVLAGAPDAPPLFRAQAARLEQVYEQLWRSRMNFQANAGLVPRNE